MTRPPKTGRLSVLHVIPYLWSGAGAALTRLCESQRERHEVHLVTSRPGGGLRDWPSYRRRLVEAGVELHQIDLFSRAPERVWPEVRALAGLLDRVRPDLVHAHAGVPALAAGLARRLAGSRAPIVGQMYSWGVGRPSWMNDMDACGFALADRVVVSAADYRRRLERLGVPRSIITEIPWGLPIDEIERSKPLGRPGASRPRIGFVGRIEPRKGQIELARAFRLLLAHHPDAELNLIGPIADERYAARIREEAARWGLEGRIRMRGRVRDPWPHIRTWDLFVSLSSDEGQGLAVQEAMALGVPVAALSAPGIDDYLVGGRNAVALENRRPLEVARALSQALGDPARLAVLARRARGMVRRRYAWPQTIAAFESLYRSLLD